MIVNYIIRGDEVLKRIFKSFTFWLIVISLFGILLHQIGQDSKSIVLIGFNPILKTLSYSDAVREFMNSGFAVKCETIAGEISIYWYIGSVITLAFYGFILDLLKCFIVKINKRRCRRGSFRKNRDFS